MPKIETILNRVEADKKGAYANWVKLVDSEKKVAVEKRTIPPFIRIVFEEIQKKAKDVQPRLLSNVWQNYTGRKLPRDLNWTGSKEFKIYYRNKCRAVPRLGDYWELSNCGFDNLKALYAKGQLLPNSPWGVATTTMASSKLLTWAVNKRQEKIQGGELEAEEDKTVFNWILSLPGIDVNVDKQALKVLRTRVYQRPNGPKGKALRKRKYQLFSSLVSHPHFRASQTLFKEACRLGDMDAVKILFENKKANPRTPDEKGMTPLMIAVQAEKLQMVQFLLPMLSLDNLELEGGNKQETVLAMATCLKHGDIAEAIGTRQKELTEQRSKLLKALKDGKLGDLKQDLKASKLTVDMYVLQEAAKSACKIDMTLLLRRLLRARNLTWGEFGRLVVTSLKCKNNASKESLLNRVNGKSEASKLQALLFHACRSNDVTLVKAFRTLGVEYHPNSVKEAAAAGYIGVLKALLGNGNEIPRKALSLAVKNGHHETAKFLRDRGAKYDPSLVTESAEKGDVQMLTALHRDGDKIPDVALALAVYKGRVEVVGFLLDKKANIEATLTSKGGRVRPALWWALTRKHAGTATLLLDRGATVTAAEVVRAYRRVPQVLKQVLQKAPKGAASQAVHPQTKVPLVYDSVQSKNLGKLTALLGGGASANTPHKGETPLQLATRLGDQDMIDLLQSPAPKPKKKPKEPLEQKKSNSGFPGWVISSVGMTLVASLAMLYLYQKGYLMPKALPKVA